jgi:3-oxoacyl-[acyl-carrier protein] reductase
MVELFSQEGAAVVINDVDEKPARETAEFLKSKGGRAAVCMGSVTKPDDATRLMKTAVDQFGSLDILVNNAGITRDGVIHKMTDEQWNFVLEVCLRGTFNCIRAASPYMRAVAKREKEQGIEKHRKIVNVSSIAGTTGNAGQANYAAAKAGIVGLTKTIAKEWAQFLIHVNAVAPGFIETRLTAAKKEGEEIGIPEEQRMMVMNPIVMPMGPGKPLDIARAALFFASPLSDYITGQVLTVSGGMLGTY